MHGLPDQAESFVLQYERRYPERQEAFRRFFRRTDRRFFLHIVNIKFMVYQLDEEILEKMLGLMRRPWGIYIQLFSEKNPEKNGASAYFGRDFWRRARIRYYEIDKKRQLNPPYKTFFHEFGHALDDLSKRGRRFCSDSFLFTQEAKKNCLRYGENEGIFMDTVRVTETKTIHEWAVFDVENYLIRTGIFLIQEMISQKQAGFPVPSEASSVKKTMKRMPPSIQYRVLCLVIYDLFLCPGGEEKLNDLVENRGDFRKETDGWERNYVGEIKELYEEIQRETGQKTLKNVQDTIVLPKDIFGGITNNQLGGGHGKEYWFRKKRRIREVSREAFAGYFEYRATLSDPVMQEMVINPHHCIPYTCAALEGMLKEILRCNTKIKR